MNTIWRRLGAAIARHAVLALGAVAVIAGVLSLGLGKLGFATGQDSYLDSGTATAKANFRYQELFGGEAMLVLLQADEGKSVADLFTEANLKHFADIEAAVAKGGDLTFSTITPATVLEWTHNMASKGVATSVLSRAADRDPDPAGQQARADDAQITLARAIGAGEQSMTNPEWIKFLLYANDGFTLVDGEATPPADDQLVVRKSEQSFIPDNRHAIIAVVLKGNADFDALADGEQLVRDAVKDITWDNATQVITGTPTFLTDINDYLQGGMMTLGLIAVVVMLVVLALTFGVRWRFLPLGAVVVGVVWGFGAFGLTGTKLSLVTISGLPILIGLGMDFAIQIHSRTQEEVAAAHGDASFEETLARLGPPLTLATVVAVACFLVMRISKVPMIQDFGVLLAIGIVALVVVATVMTIAILALREKRSPTTRSAKPGIAEKIVVWLGSLPRAAVYPLIGLAIVAPIIGVIKEHDAKIQSDPIMWADQQSTSIKNIHTLEAETGIASMMGVFIETSGYERNGIFTDQMAAFVHQFELGAVANEGKLLPASSSLVSVLSYLLEVPNATPLAPTGLDMLEAYQVAPPAIANLLVGENANAMQVNFYVGPSSLEERASLVSRLEDGIAAPKDVAAAIPDRATATPAGLARVGTALLGNLTSGRAAFAYVTLLLVFGLLLLRFRNVALAVLTMLPVLLALGVADILIAILGITLSPLTTVGAPLVIALCAEFSILMVARFAEERERGLGPREAIDEASARTGKAFTASALATIGGFGVLVFAALPLLRDFGLIVMLKVIVALASALIVVPPVAVWADERGLLGFGAAGKPRARVGGSPVAVLGIVALVAGVWLGVAQSKSSDEAAAAPVTVAAAPEPATTPPPTTLPPTTTLAPGATTTTLPPGPAEKPEGLVAGAVYDVFVGAGADPGVARCAADALLAKTPEGDLLAKGIASTPPGAEAAALVTEAANACGVSEEVQAGVRAATGG